MMYYILYSSEVTPQGRLYCSPQKSSDNYRSWLAIDPARKIQEWSALEEIPSHVLNTYYTKALFDL